LWHELWKAAEYEPLIGHGYGAFWGEENVLRYSEIFSWHIPHGHNAYLDMVLATGFVGAALYVAWVVATAAVAAARHERTGRVAHLYVACLLILSLVHGATESKFPGAGIGGFILFVAIAATTIRRPTFAAQPIATRPALALTQPRRRRWRTHRAEPVPALAWRARRLR
jgi:O-antigen ligase